MFKKLAIASITGGLVLSIITPVVYASENSSYITHKKIDELLTSESVYPDLLKPRITNVEEYSESSTNAISTELERQTESSVRESGIKEESREISSTVAQEESTTEQRETLEQDSSINSVLNAQEINIAGEVEVSNWEEFVRAFSDQAVTKISLKNEISKKETDTIHSKTTARTSSIELAGNSHLLDIGDDYFVLGTTSQRVLKLNNIQLKQNLSDPKAQDAIFTTNSLWKFELNDFDVLEPSHRVAWAPSSELIITGDNNVTTKQDNFTLKKATFKNQAKYHGRVTEDAPVFQYNAIGDSGRGFTLEPDSDVTLEELSDSSDGFFPAIYNQHGRIEIGKNSKLKINVPGSAIRFNHSSSAVNVRTNATLEINSRNKTRYSVIAFSADNTAFVTDLGARLFVTGKSNAPLVNLAANITGDGSISRRGNEFLLIELAEFDLYNASGEKYPAVQVNYGNVDGSKLNNQPPDISGNEFRFERSDIKIWDTNSSGEGTPTGEYVRTERVAISGSGTGERNFSGTSVDPDLKRFKPKDYIRIAGRAPGTTPQGSLEFISVPIAIDFGSQVVQAIEQTLIPETLNGKLIVSDTRETSASWQLLLSEKKPLSVGDKELNDVFFYTRSDGQSVSITETPDVVETGNPGASGEVILSENWDESYGLSIVVPVTKQLVGAYSGELNWILRDVPENP